MAKTVNRLALQQSLVRNGIADDPAAGNVADDWGDEIDEVTSDLATKEDLEVFGRELIATVNLRFAEMQADLERRDKERAERESEWWRLQQERDDKWRAEQRERDEAREKRDEAREKRDDDWRREQQEREDKWREEQRKRDEAREKRDEEWRKEQQERDDKWHAEQRERDEAQRKRDEKWREEQRERDEAQRKRDQEAAKTTSKILWALFGSAGLIGTVVGIVVAVT